MKNLNTKAHIHARELLKSAEKREMQFVLHTDTMGGYHLLNCWEKREITTKFESVCNASTNQERMAYTICR